MPELRSLVAGPRPTTRPAGRPGSRPTQTRPARFAETCRHVAGRVDARFRSGAAHGTIIGHRPHGRGAQAAPDSPHRLDLWPRGVCHDGFGVRLLDPRLAEARSDYARHFQVTGNHGSIWFMGETPRSSPTWASFRRCLCPALQIRQSHHRRRLPRLRRMSRECLRNHRLYRS